MATVQEVIAALQTSAVSVSSGNVKESREGDKVLRFHQVNEILNALLVAKKIEEMDEQDSASGMGVGFVT